MQLVDFSQYPYVPSILADPIGELAYERLEPQTKRGILPLFELCWRPRARGFEASLDTVEALGAERPFLLDIDKRPAPEPYISADPRNPLADKLRYRMDVAAKAAFDAELQRLYRPDSGFFNWRDLISRFSNAVPVIQVTNAKAQRDDVIRQVQLLCAGGASAAFRITQMFVEEVCSLVADVLLCVDNPRQILIIIDCGQARSQTQGRSAFVARVLQTVREHAGPVVSKELRFVCMSNSFALPDGKGICFRENLDWEVWRRISTDAFLAFGDYAGSQRSAHSSYRPGGWVPTVTHALDSGWLIHRHANKNDPRGWVEGCRSVRGDARFSPTDSWCDKIIRATAGSGVSELDQQRAWHATRMNGHIERQYEHAKRVVKKIGR